MEKQNPVTFQDFCKIIGIRHYADSKTYEKINFIWSIIYKEIEKKNVLPYLLNYGSLVNYLNIEYSKVDTNQVYTYYYILQEFQRYQINAEIFAANYAEFMGRFKGYVKARKCESMNKLKEELDRYLARMKVDREHVSENTRDFIIMARYICDYLEEYPSDIPSDLFYYNGIKPSTTKQEHQSKEAKKGKKDKSKTKIGDKLKEAMQDITLV